MGRVLPKLRKGASGSYEMEIRADPVKRREELERRRRCAKSICRAAYERCSQDFWDASYYLHPGEKVSVKAGYSSITLTDIHKKINEAIVADTVKDWLTDYVPAELRLRVRAHILYRFGWGAAAVLEYPRTPVRLSVIAAADVTAHVEASTAAVAAKQPLPPSPLPSDDHRRECGTEVAKVATCIPLAVHELRQLATGVAIEIIAYYDQYPRNVSDVWLKAKNITRDAYVKESQQARKRAWADAKGERAFDKYAERLDVRLQQLQDSPPLAFYPRHTTPIGPALGSGRSRRTFHRPVATGKNPAPADIPLAGCQLSESHKVTVNRVQQTALLLLEVNTLTPFRQNGVFDASLLYTMELEELEDLDVVDLLVRNGKQQEAARNAYKKLGFRGKVPKKERVSGCSPARNEIYMRVDAAVLRANLASKLDEQTGRPSIPLTFVVQQDFKPRSRWKHERLAGAAIDELHKPVNGGDGAVLETDLMPSKDHHPIVLFAFAKLADRRPPPERPPPPPRAPPRARSAPKSRARSRSAQPNARGRQRPQQGTTPEPQRNSRRAEEDATSEEEDEFNEFDRHYGRGYDDWEMDEEEEDDEDDMEDDMEE